MAITVDDGTFETGNSFVTIAEADAFHSARLNTDWTEASDEDKEAALIRAFDFLSVQPWASKTFTSSIPLKIQNAQCIGALKEIQTSGTLQPDITPGVKKESIDGVMENEFYETARGSGGTVHTAVENMIRPFLKRPGMQRRLVRG